MKSFTALRFRAAVKTLTSLRALLPAGSAWSITPRLYEPAGPTPVKEPTREGTGRASRA